MASPRKKYQLQLESRQDDAPVASTPVQTAEPPPAVEAKPPPEMPEATEAPAEKAGREALRNRLAEMERAETLTRQAQQPPQRADEPPQQPPQPAMPAHVQKWVTEHPQYCDPNDHVAQAEIYTATLKCNRDGKSWDQPDFIPTLERHLGIAGNGQAQHRPVERPPAAPAPAPRRVEQPVRQHAGPPVSAQPTRESPSMATGRPQSFRAPLTKDELLIAQQCGQTPEQYQMQKEKMLRMKAAGQIQDA